LCQAWVRCWQLNGGRVPGPGRAGAPVAGGEELVADLPLGRLWPAGPGPQVQGGPQWI